MIQNIEISKEIKIIGKVKLLNKGITNNKEEFYSFRLFDGVDDIQARIWNASDIIIKEGGVYQFTGKGHDHNGKLQLIITDFEISKLNKKQEKLFYKTAPVGKNILNEEIKQYINTIDNVIIKEVLKEVLNRYGEQLLVYPAAKQNHHAYLSGLAYHTVTMLKLAETFKNLYQFLDKDYLYAGVILHDFAKIIELSESKNPEYTMEGKLLGHLVIGNNLIKEIGNYLNFNDREEILFLQHLIISHHGHKEWGSAQRPMLAEAEVLYYLDSIDSKLESIRLVFESTVTGKWSKKIPVLEGRSFYKHK